MKTLIRLTVALCFVLAAGARAEANWAAVAGQTATSSGNDAVLTFTSAIGSGNTAIILMSTGVQTDTFSITGTTMTWSTVAGPVDGASAVVRTYVFCATGDGVDNTFTVTSSGTAQATAFGIEFTGGTCTLDGVVRSTETTTTTTHALATDVTTTNTNSLLLSVIRSTSAADFNPDATMTQFGTDALQVAAEYRILTSAGTFDAPWTSAANETTLLVGLALSASGGAPPATAPPSLLLLGVGGNP